MTVCQMNSIEKYLAAASGVKKIRCGQRLTLRVDLALAHDGSASAVMQAFKELHGVFALEPQKFVLTVDHGFPSPTPRMREIHLAIKAFWHEHGFRLYDHGEGILHQVVAEKETPRAGQVVVGADGHVLTSAAFGALCFSVTPEELAQVLASGSYRVEVPETVLIRLKGQFPPGTTAKDLSLFMLQNFGRNRLRGKAVIVTGPIVRRMDLADKMTFCNILGEMGIRTALLVPKEAVWGGETYTLSLSKLEPLVAYPSSPDNVKSIYELVGQKISQVYIGGCTNGRLKDMEIIAGVLDGQSVHPDVNLIVGPASRQIANAMDALGITTIIREAGGIVISPGCGACSGIHQGVASAEDIILTTTARNTAGRMGDPAARIFMVSPQVATASAVLGKVTDR
jgi:3-isopropylmalate/(R)-2-methylmalate dehydratase large subunit